MDEIFTGEHIRVRVDVLQELIEIDWTGPVNGLEFKKAGEQAILAAIDLDLRKWLLHQRNMRIIPHDLRWALGELLPRAVPFLRRDSLISIVLSEDFYGKYYINKILHEIFPQGNLSIFYFYDYYSAQEWLLEAGRAMEPEEEHLVLL